MKHLKQETPNDYTFTLLPPLLQHTQPPIRGEEGEDKQTARSLFASLSLSLSLSPSSSLHLNRPLPPVDFRGLAGRAGREARGRGKRETEREIETVRAG